MKDFHACVRYVRSCTGFRMSSFAENAQTTAKRSFENVELRRVATDFDRLRARRARITATCIRSVENVELRRGRVDDGEALL